MNLKKSAGGGACNEEQLEGVFRQDKGYLAEQFSIYNPDLIICCGTGNLVYELLGKGAKKSRTHRGIDYCEYSKNQFLIWFLHPQAHNHAYFMFYALIDAVKEIRGIVQSPSAS